MARKSSPWTRHVQATYRKNPSAGLGAAMKAASRTWKKQSGGSANLADVASPINQSSTLKGGRRRSSRKTRKSRSTRKRSSKSRRH